jgi:hypothetical protein
MFLVPRYHPQYPRHECTHTHNVVWKSEGISLCSATSLRKLKCWSFTVVSSFHHVMKLLETINLVRFIFRGFSLWWLGPVAAQ